MLERARTYGLAVATDNSPKRPLYEWVVVDDEKPMAWVAYLLDHLSPSAWFPAYRLEEGEAASTRYLRATVAPTQSSGSRGRSPIVLASVSRNPHAVPGLAMAPETVFTAGPRPMR